jgi:hypothetical protein
MAATATISQRIVNRGRRNLMAEISGVLPTWYLNVSAVTSPLPRQSAPKAKPTLQEEAQTNAVGS